MLTSPQRIEGVLEFGVGDPYEPHWATITPDSGSREDIVQWLENTYWDGRKVRVTIEAVLD